MADEIKPLAIPAATEKKEEKKISMLESVINETYEAIKSGFYLSSAAAMPYFLSKSFPAAALDIGTFTAANVAADATTNIRRGKKNTMKEVFKSSAVATALSLPIHYLYKAVNQISLDSVLGYVGRAAAFGGIAYPAFVGMYQAADYTIKNGTFKGLGNYLKENFLPTLKTAWKYLLPISLMNVFFVPSYLQVAVGSAMSYFFSLFGAPKKGEIPESEKRDKTPYYKILGNIGEKVFTLPGKAFDSAYGFGSGIRDYFSSKPPPAAPAAVPQAA